MVVAALRGISVRKSRRVGRKEAKGVCGLGGSFESVSDLGFIKSKRKETQGSLCREEEHNGSSDEDQPPLFQWEGGKRSKSEIDAKDD